MADTQLDDTQLDQFTSKMWSEMPMSKRLLTGFAPAGILFAPLLAVLMVPLDFGGSAVLIFASMKELLFAGAAGFGLIHGLAFASTLADLHLESSQMALSILGFNIGIELMQLVIMALIIPSLIVLSTPEWYAVVRMTGANFAAIAAIAWIFERISGQSNLITDSVAVVATYGTWVVGALFLAAVTSHFKGKKA